MRDLGHEAKRIPKDKMVQLLMREIDLGMLDMERIRRYSVVDGENADEPPTVTAETDSVIPLSPTVLDSVDSSVIDVIQSLNCDKRSYNITTTKLNASTTTWHEWYDGECGLFDESVPTADNPTMENKPDDFAGSPSATNARQESPPYVSDGVPPISETFDMDRRLVTANENSIIPPTIHVLDAQDLNAMCSNSKHIRGKHVIRDGDHVKEMIEAGNLHNFVNKEQLKWMLQAIQSKLEHNGIRIKHIWSKAKIVDSLRGCLGLSPLSSDTRDWVKSKTSKQELNAMKKASLNYIYCKITYEKKLLEQGRHSIIPDDIPIIVDGISRTADKWFSQPEYISSLQLTHFAFIDPSHILTCIRSLICRKGIPERGINTEAWLSVARDGKLNGSNLNMSDVNSTMMMDKQKVIIAEKMFSREVQAVMEIRGFVEEARFCHVMRDRWEAEDMRGLSAATRYHRRMALRDWLMEKIDFSTYHPIGMFTTGIPTVRSSPSWQTAKGAFSCILTWKLGNTTHDRKVHLKTRPYLESSMN